MVANQKRFAFLLAFGFQGLVYKPWHENATLLER
jgi:hypothetical protein